jgi:predicted permease
MNYFFLAARALRKSPGLSLSIVLLLGFGIGANTALFSVLHAILLRPIPGVQHSGDLIRVRRSWNGRAQSNQSYPDYVDLRDRAKSLAGLAAERTISLRMAGPPAQMVPGAIVTGNYFQVLGVRAAAGRLLGPEDDRTPGAHPVVVLSERFWRQQYGGDPALLGRTLILNGYPFTVAGIAAAPFDGVQFGERADFWMPMMMVRAAMTRSPDYHWLTERAAGWLTFYARLKPGIRPQTAEAELNTIARQLEALYPATNSGRSYLVNAPAGMAPEQRASLRSLLGLLGVAVSLVLLIACGNVANLLLARATGRSREMAIRLALGADRRVLLAHLMAESVLLGLGGAALGLLLAPWMRSVLRNVWSPQQLALETSRGLDLRLLGFTLGISLLAVLLCGLAPAWIASRMDAGAALKTGSPRAGGRSRLQQVWVVAQVTLSVALVAAGSMVLRSMQRIVAIDPGYQPDRIVMATMDLSVLGYSPERGTRTFLDLLQCVSAVPGVRSASLAKSSPAVDWSDRVVLFRQGEAPANTAFPAKSPGAVTADQNVIAPGYFRTLEIPLLAGRDFTLEDRSGTTSVAIVSKALAEQLWHGENPIGKRIVVPAPRQSLPGPLLVVGVAADSRYRSVLDAPPLLLYIPVLQTYDSIAKLMVAVDGSPSQFAGALRRLIQEANPDLPVRISTMRDQLDLSVWRQRAATSLLSFFGLLALALACAGINGVVAYGAAQRTREIGIRMALGAGRAHVLREVVGQAVRLTAAGIALGLPLALWAQPALASFLYGASSLEPLAVAGVPLLFVAVAVGASFRPARRAAATDPVMALRQE